MNDDTARATPRRTGFINGALLALCLILPALGSPSDTRAEKASKERDEAAAKVARKVEKALQKARKAEQEPLEADRRAVREFQDEVEDYAKLHQKELARQGEPRMDDAATALAAQQALARAIQAKRAKARQGDIFARAVQPIFRRLLAAELQGPDALAARQAVIEGNPHEEEPGVAVELRVNALYPAGAPRSTVPASVLLTLPPLPDCLHYRFVGRDLILVDSLAQVIVDFLPASTPTLRAK